MITAEQVKDAWCGNLKRDCLYDPPAPDWQAIADELNATLGAGTCHNTDDDSGWFGCSECKCTCSVDWWGSGLGVPNFCPHCGRKVER